MYMDTLRITPAHAGKTTPDQLKPGKAEDHPRSRGENYHEVPK